MLIQGARVVAVATEDEDLIECLPAAVKDFDSDPENTTTFVLIATSTFLVCFDDDLPSTSSHGGRGEGTQFLFNHEERPFAIRWLDKTLHFVQTANGFSAEL